MRFHFSPIAAAPIMLLHMRDISKSFFGVSVLRGIDLTLNAGETLVLAGENGAGKSTLMKILGGVHAQDSGEILVEGASVRFKKPQESERHGIAIIHQELSSIGCMSVVDNLFLGREKSQLGFLKRREQIAAAQKMLQPLGLDIDVTQALESYPIAVRQLVEIARATSRDANIIVMDEPTSALADPDVDRLVSIMSGLKARGAGIIFISHKMSEIYRVADRIMVMRDGSHVATAPAGEMSGEALIHHLVGRELTGQIPDPPPIDVDAPVILEVESLTVDSPARPGQWFVKDLRFSARRGEILGFSGLQGSGCSHVFMALYGALGKFARAGLKYNKLSQLPRSPQDAIDHGIAYLPSDRKESGLILQMPISSNISLASLPRFSRGGWLRNGQERATAASHIKALRIRTTGPEQEVVCLSGGNQQKVLLARCLETRPTLLMLDEPTRGVDVGAKHEIYELISRIREQGTTILLITTEMPEMLGLADRICVLHRGEMTALIDRASATQEGILAAAMGEQGNH